MKLRSLIIIFCTALVGACSHLSIPTIGVPSEKPSSDSSVTLEPDIIDADTLPAENTSLPAEDGTGMQSESGEIANQATAAPKSAPVIVQDLDLLTKIRNGFSFPAFGSADVASYERWSSEHPTYLRNLFARAEPFLHHIIGEIEKRQLPMELALLPAIESAYKPNAVSRSKAAGLWQFIPSTGKAYGLQQNWWYDGRHDLIASTEAALDYLSELNQRFEGDWFLTLAAYNAGQGTVARAIAENKRRNRPTQYQDLKLRTETKRYVPKLIALKNIISNPQLYGVTLPTMRDDPQFAKIALPPERQIDLALFANKSDIDQDRLRNLNAGFLRWATPPGGPKHMLVPLSRLGQAHRSMDELAAQPPLNLHHHKIRKGETLSHIARKYKVEVAALKSSNRMKNNNIRAGRSLLIPISAHGSNGQALPGLTGPGRAVPGQAVPGQAKANTTRLVHHVKPGETLWSIAKRYRVQVKQLLAWNKISSDQILSLNQAITVLGH